MKTVTLEQIDEKTIHVSSDDNPLGKFVIVENFEEVEDQMMVAFAEYCGLDLTLVEEDEDDEEEFDDLGEDGWDEFIKHDWD